MINPYEIDYSTIQEQFPDYPHIIMQYPEQFIRFQIALYEELLKIDTKAIKNTIKYNILDLYEALLDQANHELKSNMDYHRNITEKLQALDEIINQYKKS